MGEPATPARLLSEFFRRSRPSIDALAIGIVRRSNRRRPDLPMFRFEDGRKVTYRVPGTAFLLRTSVEYANPQLTLEEFQGILLARLLEVSAEFVACHPVDEPTAADLHEMEEALRSPPVGAAVPFLMNVDDVEADRYSINPLRRSIASSGQSGRAVAGVRTDRLEIDAEFLRRYSGSLVALLDAEDVTDHLNRGGEGRYVDLVDATKYTQLDRISSRIGIDLTIPAMRMPLEPLAAEAGTGPLHRLVQAAFDTPDSLDHVYRIFGRRFGPASHRSLLPAVPHAPDGTSSKRIARGRLRQIGERIEGVEVRYSSGPLYPNEIDPTDVARATADATVEVPWERMRRFDFRKTPATPLFALYMLLSPEDGAIWHGVGRYSGSQLVGSYTNARRACLDLALLRGTSADCRPEPIQWDLVAETMLRNPVSGNIDASVSCVPDLTRRLLGSVDLRVLSNSYAGGSAPEPRVRPAGTSQLGTENWGSPLQRAVSLPP